MSSMEFMLAIIILYGIVVLVFFSVGLVLAIIVLAEMMVPESSIDFLLGINDVKDILIFFMVLEVGSG